MKVNEHNLLQTLQTLKLEPKVQPETQQIYVIFEHEGVQFPLFIRELHEGELVQLLSFIPCNLDAKGPARERLTGPFSTDPRRGSRVKIGRILRRFAVPGLWRPRRVRATRTSYEF